MSTIVNRRRFLRLAGLTSASVALAACTSQKPAAPGQAQPVVEGESASANGPSNGSQAKKGALLSTQLDHVVKFSYLRAMWGPTTYQKGSDYEQVLFKAGNVEIEPLLVPVQDLETKLPVMVAGGSVADVIWHQGPSWGPAHDWIEQGAFLPIDDLLNKYTGVRDAISQDVWNSVKSPDGKTYFIPNGLPFWVPFPIFYRADVFRDLGIAKPISLDELVAAMRTIKAKKPEMIPFTSHQPALWYFKELATAFGYNMGGWVPDPNDSNSDNPSQIVPGYTVKERRDFLEFMQMLRKEELLDPDFLIAQNKNGLDKFNGGQAAMMVGHWGIYHETALQLRKVDPNADCDVLGSIQGPAHKMGGITLRPYDRGFSFSVQAKDKIEDIFAYLNWAFTEGYDLVYHGVPGEMYNKDEDGSYIGVADEKRKPGFKRENHEPFWLVPKTVDVNPNWLETYKSFKENGLENKVPMLRQMFIEFADNTLQDYNRNTYSITAGKKGGELYTQYIKLPEEKVIIDPSTALSTIDDSVQGWLQNGGNAIIKETNETQMDKSNPLVTYQDTGKPLPEA